MLHHNDNVDFRDIIRTNNYFSSNINIYTYNDIEFKTLVLQQIKNVLTYE